MTGGGKGRGPFACNKSARGEDEKKKKCIQILALTMLSSSPRSPELQSLGFSLHVVHLAAQNKNSLLKFFPNSHSLARHLAFLNVTSIISGDLVFDG